MFKKIKEKLENAEKRDYKEHWSQFANMQIILPDMKNKLINIKPIMSKLNGMLKATGKSFSELEDKSK